MSVRVDRAVSEVTTEPEPTAAAGGEPEPEWALRERQRGLHAALARDRQRTAAEGFDD